MPNLRHYRGSPSPRPGNPSSPPSTLSSNRVSAGHRAVKPDTLFLAPPVAGIRHINYHDTNTLVAHIATVFQVCDRHFSSTPDDTGAEEPLLRLLQLPSNEHCTPLVSPFKSVSRDAAKVIWVKCTSKWHFPLPAG